MSSHSHNHAAVAPAEVLDPVCGMTISPDDAVGHVDHKGRTYYFCSQSCLDQFRANPDAFLAERPAPAATPAETASMTRRHWRQRTSVSPWVQERMWRWRAQA